MELRNDDLQPVTLLSNSFSDVLQSSRTKTDKIEDLLKKIGKYTDSKTEELFKHEPDHKDTEELDELDRLRNENLDLMMEIQRQEFVSKKWMSLVQQNQNILETIRNWLIDNPDTMMKTTIELQNQFHEIEKHYKSSIIGLRYDVKHSEECIEKVVQILQNLDDEFSTMTAQNNVTKYNEKRNQLTNAINKLQKLHFQT